MVFYSIRLGNKRDHLLVAQCHVKKGEDYRDITICPGVIKRVQFPRLSEKLISQTTKYSSQFKPPWDPPQTMVYCYPVPENEKTSVLELLKSLNFSDYRGSASLYSKSCVTPVDPRIIHRGIPIRKFIQDYVAVVNPREKTKLVVWTKS